MAEVVIYYEGPLVTRVVAKTRGANRYFTGKPCKFGHLSERHIDGKCVICRQLYKRSLRETPLPEPNNIRVYYSGLVITRSDAAAIKLKRYFTGKPCKHGHVCERYVVKGTCIECVRIDAQSLNGREIKRSWRSTDHGRAVVARGRQRYGQTEKAKEAFGRYRASKKGKLNRIRYVSRRRALLRNLVGEFTAEDHQRLVATQSKCHICGKRFTKRNPPTLDHVIALANGGRHEASNIALAHGSCNKSKRDRRTHLI